MCQCEIVHVCIYVCICELRLYMYVFMCICERVSECMRKLCECVHGYCEGPLFGMRVSWGVQPQPCILPGCLLASHAGAWCMVAWTPRAAFAGCCL